jgi:ribosomal protein S27AE
MEADGVMKRERPWAGTERRLVSPATIGEVASGHNRQIILKYPDVRLQLGVIKACNRQGVSVTIAGLDEGGTRMKSGECPKCKSQEVLANVRINDRGYPVDGELQIEVQARPMALVLKGRTKSILRAWLCGSCGYVELYNVNPEGFLAEHEAKL